MSLNWNIEKCDNYKELWTPKERAVTNALIWATMSVMMSDITAKNYTEFYRRLHVVELQNGTWLGESGRGKYVPYYMTLADVKRRIGLSTNAGTYSKSHFDAFRKKKALADN